MINARCKKEYLRVIFRYAIKMLLQIKCISLLSLCAAQHCRGIYTQPGLWSEHSHKLFINRMELNLCGFRCVIVNSFWLLLNVDDAERERERFSGHLGLGSWDRRMRFQLEWLNFNKGECEVFNRIIVCYHIKNSIKFFESSDAFSPRARERDEGI